MTIVDAWIQHPTPRMLADPMFDSLRRWTGSLGPAEIPLERILPAACLAEVPALGLDEEATSLFLHGNAERVFHLGG
jgi:hypothetical protein